MVGMIRSVPVHLSAQRSLYTTHWLYCNTITDRSACASMMTVVKAKEFVDVAAMVKLQQEYTNALLLFTKQTLFSTAETSLKHSSRAALLQPPPNAGTIHEGYR